jgi:hypothetical protein
MLTVVTPTVLLLLILSMSTLDAFFAPVKKAKTSETASVATKLAAQAPIQKPMASSAASSVVKAPEKATSTTNDSMTPWKLAVENMEPGWKNALSAQFSKPYFARLMAFLESERKAGKVVYPPIDQLFSAFTLCPFEQVRVVCVGQDPYHGPGQAHGLAFSVGRGVAIPPSLRNMLKEAVNDGDLSPKMRPDPGHGNLEKWAKQGVRILSYYVLPFFSCL